MASYLIFTKFAVNSKQSTCCCYLVWNDKSGCECTTSHQEGLVYGRRKVKVPLRTQNRDKKKQSTNPIHID